MPFSRTVRTLLFATALTVSVALCAAAQDTAHAVIVGERGERSERTLTAPSQIEVVMREFLAAQQDGVITITTWMESGQDETILWAKKAGEKVSFTPDESQWISVAEALDRFRGANAFPHLSACQKNQERLGEAIDQWAEAHQGALPQRMDQLVPEILGELPVCPTAPNDSYASSYKLSESKRYTFHCPGNHEEAGVPLTFPAYDGVNGVRLP